MFKPVLVTAPSSEEPIVSLEDAKLYCRIDEDDDDDVITSLIAAATSRLDGYSGILGRCLIEQEWRQDFYGWSNILGLPFPDVSAVSVKYFDSDAVGQTVSSDDYEIVDTHSGVRVCFKNSFSFPSLDEDRSNPVQVTFTCGYGPAVDKVPADLILAAKTLIAHFYENREAVSSENLNVTPMAFDTLIAPYQRHF